MGLASSGGGERVCRACSRQMRQRPTVSQWPVPQASRPAFVTCKCVSMCMAGEARTHDAAHAWCVRDERALRACARVQSAEQRARAWQWRGEARCATCLFVRLCSRANILRAKNAKRAYSHISATGDQEGATISVGAATATPVATLVATLHVDGHGAEAFYGRSKRKEEDQNDGSAGSSRRA